MNFNITTFGCKANQYDSSGIAELMKTKDYVKVDDHNKPCDVHIINSCTVTENADRKVKSLITRLKRENPHVKVILCGCFPKAFPEKARLTGADEIIEGKLVESPPTSLQKERTRAFLKIQDGCNRSCAYCIIPKARGETTSRSIADITDEAGLLSKYHKEIVITGINLCLYEHGLVNAVKAVCGVEDVQRVRLGSLEPDLISEHDIIKLSELVKQACLCNHVHLSLQSGSDTVLKRMNRQYDTDYYRKIVSRFRGFAVTTDIIVGFPGETEEEFMQTLQFVEEIGFAKVHVFPFSKRDGTVAYSMPEQISKAVKQERSARLTELADTLRSKHFEGLIGTEQEVLIEKDGLGYTKCYTPIKIDGNVNQNSIVRINIQRSNRPQTL
jgi:threonylcarbamoyladenosine tRNA methylthiotransferase MtaB